MLFNSIFETKFKVQKTFLQQAVLTKGNINVKNFINVKNSFWIFLKTCIMIVVVLS